MVQFVRDVAPKFRQAVEQLPHLPRALTLVRQAAGRWTLAWAVLLVIQSILPVAVVLVTRRLVDSVVAATGAGTETIGIREPLLLAVVMASLLLASELTRALAQWVRTAQAELVSDHIRELIQERAAAVDMAFYDTPQYFDTLHRARFDAQTRPAALVESLGTLLQGGLTLIAMGAVLFGYAWWLPLILLLSTVPALFVVMQAIVRRHEWTVKSTMDQRRSTYFEFMQSTRETFAEIRLYDLAVHFRTSFTALRDRLRGERLDLARSEAGARVLAGLAGLTLLGASLVWMLLDALHGVISLGQLAMFGQAFLQGQRLLRSSLENLGQIYSNLLFLGNLFEFLELEPTITDPADPQNLPSPIRRGVTFRDISFTYPTSTRPALEHFSLDVPAGSTVALLGRSGAGKSTLFKLLLRFYDPDRGLIEIDGINIRHLRQADLRRHIAVLFQAPLEFSTTVSENIAYGDLEAGRDPENIVRALEAAGARSIIDRLSEGKDTMLGPWFGGTELSLGEWQRIALSRAFLRDADIVLLDEPTSAMDSWAEAEWLSAFKDHVRGRTTIVITHRLSTARHADLIHVLHDRRITESGTHDELLALGGRYAAAWRYQVGDS
ncbi:MAG: ABC transporter ATP-binding protein [Acidobacteria bacterium]|nr:ABC transporter ATP-binding protein [Acidobacteriota bacterium]